MIRKFAAFVLAAVVLAGMLLLPSPAVANGKPTVLLCLVPDPDPHVVEIPIPEGRGGMPLAVAICFSAPLYGHPIGAE